MSNTVELKSRISSDMVHNRNCYEYLQQLQPFITKKVSDLLPGLSVFPKLGTQYYPQFPYGDLYSFIIAYLEEQIDQAYNQLNPAETEDLDNLIYSLYHNNNHILDEGDWLHEIKGITRPREVNTESKIARKLVDSDNSVNKLSPMKAESLLNRFLTLFTPNFKPQHDTNLPSIKNFSFNSNSAHLEYRFSTQAQRHNGAVRISPLFKRWLKINAQKFPPEQSICHIYFNNLGLDRNDIFDIPGSNEKELSLELHKLEQDPELKIAVITLPASKAIMSSNHYQKINDHRSYKKVFKEFLDVAEGKMHETGISDFRISPKIRKELFDTDANQYLVLKNLLKNSFTNMGIKKGEPLSTAQKQAVWLHFTKFELTDFVISKLTPQNSSIGYNFSCRDAIDRGALSSTYYNLIKSIKLNQPMQQMEFERTLDIAAANVKGRGMNFHRKIIWNALDTLVNANYDSIIQDARISWLVYWRDMNCPHSRVHQLINIRINQCKEQFNHLPTEQQDIKTTGLKLLSQISQQYEHNVSGQRLLLEVVARTSQLLCTSPDEASLLEYKNLASELKINHPLLHIVGGIMETLLGLLLYVPSFGYSNILITQGMALAKTGFFASERNALCDEILEFSVKNNTAIVA